MNAGQDYHYGSPCRFHFCDDAKNKELSRMVGSPKTIEGNIVLPYAYQGGMKGKHV